MSKIHKFPFAIAYADTDAGGIVYHGRYIEIAERAHELVTRYGGGGRGCWLCHS